MKGSPFTDEEFLVELVSQKHREIFAKIISLNFDEYPIEEISGHVTGGSVNIDGASAIRRTCNLTLVADDININDYYWGLNTKFKLYIGLKNNINKNYDDIIWFKQGMFLINSFNTTLNDKSYTISISGKDKMCMLNGEIGGTIESLSADFGKYEVLDEENNLTGKLEDYLLKDIVREAVHHYGKEPFSNIIVEDLDMTGLQYLEYRGDVPVYLFINAAADEVDGFVLETDINQNYYTDNNGDTVNIKNIIYNKMFDRIPEGNNNPTIVHPEGNMNISQTVAKITYGDCCGYRLTDLTYAGGEGENSDKDLILQAGSSITQMLDKIVNMLGSYEYFYDVDGRFHFRRKKTYTQTSWNNIISYEDEEYVDSSAYTSASSFEFTNSTLISSFQNNPKLENLRNDFAIWGQKSNKNSENSVHFHMRYAIDKKPTEYISYTGKEYKTVLNGKESLDWRELIYQMAIDYYRYGREEDFITTIARNNPLQYPTGYTGYEQYYADMQGFWRYYLYNPDLKPFDIPEIARDGDAAIYYLWTTTDEALKTGYFTPYSFHDATAAIDVPDKDYYYFDGTVTTNTLQKLFESGKIEHINNTERNQNYVYDDIESYGLWRDIEGTHLHYYQYKKAGYFEKYTQYYNCNKSGAQCYDLGTALDLSNISTTKRYYHSDTHELVSLKKIEGQYEYVGYISEEIYNNNYNRDEEKRGPYYIRKSTDTYELATEYSNAREYFKPAYVSNFNIMEDGHGVKYYSLPPYEVATNFKRGNSYYIKEYQHPKSPLSADIFYSGEKEYYFRKGENSYEKQTEYCESLQDKYYEAKYTKKFFISAEKDYIIKENGMDIQVDSFSRGNSYYIKNNGVDEFAFECENNVVYYINNEGEELKYILVKDASSVVQNGAYFAMGDTSQTNTSDFLAGNVYKGYSIVSEPISNESYYVLEDGEILDSKRKALVNFIRGTKYYYFDEDPEDNGIYMRLAEEGDISLTTFKELYYYNNDQYNNCKTRAEEILSGAAEQSEGYIAEKLLLIAQETGITYQIDQMLPYLKLSVSSIDVSRENVFIYQPRMLLEDILKYKFFEQAYVYSDNDEYYIKNSQTYERVFNVNKDNFNEKTYYTEIPSDRIIGNVYNTDKFNPLTYWTMDLEDPAQLIFWFDFLDTSTGGELSQYGADAIGSRPKAVNDEDIKAIYYREIPNVIFQSSSEISKEADRKSGYSYLFLTSELENLFVIGTQGKTAFDQLDSFLYDFSYCTESITVNAIPVYYLEPNTRISIYDKLSGINGEYLIDKITIPLTYNGTMSITATKAVDRIY